MESTSTSSRLLNLGFDIAARAKLGLGYIELIGVRIKSNYYRERFALTGHSDCVADELLMTNVHSIKETDRQANWNGYSMQFSDIVEDSHWFRNATQP